MDKDSLKEKRQYITELLKQHEEFIAIGLTGRVGSGCSDAAKIFGMSFEEIGLPPIYPGDTGLKNDDERDRRVLFRYATYHWLKFDIIKVRTIITSFIIRNMGEFCNEINEIIGEYIGEELFKKTNNLLSYNEKKEEIENIISSIQILIRDCECNGNDINFEDLSKALNQGEIDDISSFFKYLYEISDNSSNYDKRKELLKLIDELLYIVAKKEANKWWKDNIIERGTDEKFDELKKIEDKWFAWKKEDELCFEKFILVNNIIPAISDSIHDCLVKKGSKLFTELFQKYGNYIRKYGTLFNVEDDKIFNTFAIPKRINQFIKSIRHPFSRNFARPTRVVIDSIKNVFEATYLRERYSSFYLFAISTEEEIRHDRLTASKGKNLNLRDIHCIDLNEYSSKGAEIYSLYLKEKMDIDKENQDSQIDIYKILREKNNISEEDICFIEKINGEKTENNKYAILDNVRIDAYKNNSYQFVLQDVETSIQNADVFISNNHNFETKNMNIRWEIVRNVSLIMYPGLITPTRIEKCMQVAFVAKANSGCLSRQVGAVVTDSDYNILSVGWNDVPCGDVSCGKKNLPDIYKEVDLGAYTNYEIRDKNFKNRIEVKYKSNYAEMKSKLCGLPWRYCFKDIHSDVKQPMRSRAMHGEEKALANVYERAEGGYLFTTSSPCEMCSKNAKNHKIKKIYYIEPYPGISENQYSNSGDIDNRAEHILFTGAIGRAYTQMYTPIMPYKDVLGFLGL